MTPRTAGGDGFGDVATSTNKGQVKFVTETCQDRIERVLDHAEIPAAFSVVFTGNVDLRQTIYSPGEAAMTAIQEAADAEFPGVSNVYVDRLGRLCFHGTARQVLPRRGRRLSRRRELGLHRMEGRRRRRRPSRPRPRPPRSDGSRSTAACRR